MSMQHDGYMAWAKTHPRARYELSGSGAPAAKLADFDGRIDDDRLDHDGMYGEPELIQAIAAWRGVSPERVMPFVGTSLANFVALACMGAPGDLVLIETPAYDPLIRAARFLGLRLGSVARAADQGHQLNLDEVRGGLANGAKAVALTNLHNPSGQPCNEDDLERVASWCAAQGAMLLVDEVYLDYAVVNRGRLRSRTAALGDHVVITDSLTKVYGLGGLRAGWILAAPAVLARARRVVDLLNVVNPVISARLAVQAIGRIGRLADRCRQFYTVGRPVISAWLAARGDVTAYEDHGALFTWLKLPDGVSSDRLAYLLRAEYDTNVVPGSFFGCDDHIRVSLALPGPELGEGLNRIGAALDRLRKSLP